MRPLLCSLVLAAAACRCGHNVGQTAGELGLDWSDRGQRQTSRDARYDFGRVTTGTTAHVPVTVRNLGLGGLELTALDKVSGDEAFGLKLPGSTALGAGGSLELDATFAPALGHVGPVTAVFTLTSDDGTATITLAAEGVDPPCQVPNTLDFGGVALNDTVRLPLEIQNTTDVARSASIGTPMGTGASSYTVDGHALQISAHGKSSVLVAFTPTELRAYNATLGVRAGPDCPEYSVAITGRGVDQVLSWAPTPLDFGYLPLNTPSTKQLTFTNASTVDVTLSNLRASHAAYALPVGTLKIPAKSTATLDITFTPRVLGPAHGTISFDSTLNKQPSGSATVDGYGGGPDIDVKPVALSFGRVAYFASAPQTQRRRISISNLGTTAPTPAGNLHLTGTQLDVAGPNASELSVAIDPLTPYDDATGIPAIVGQNRVDVLVSLTPTSIGHKQATVTIHSNDFDEGTVTVTVTADVEALPPCHYTVAPTTLAFGVVSPPQLREQSFTITNLGANAGEICLVSALELRAGSDATFSLPAGAIAQAELQPGQVLTVKVRAWPQGARTALAQVTGDVDFFVSSDTAPSGHVALSASVGPSCLVLSPDEAQLGTVKVSCQSQPKTFNLYSTCSGTVSLQSVTIAAGGPEFFLSSTPTIPSGGLVIPNGGAPVSFTARYRPANLGPDEGQVAIVVTVNGQSETHLARLSGTGDTVGHNTDVFRQGTEAKADILLAIDGSCSMGNKQMQLATNTQAFFQYAQQQGIDYHVAVLKAQGAGSNTSVGVLTSGAGHPDKVLTPLTQNVGAQFAAKVQAIGANGADEQCFAPVVAALSAPLVSAENAGFLRQDASLAIICITDDNDFSPGSVPFYYSALVNVKGASRQSWLTVNAIAGFNNTACLGGSADNGRYSDMGTLTGGVKEEICTPNWASTLDSIARSAFGTRGTFFLTAVPDTGTVPIVVKVDGTIEPAVQGSATVWSYDASTNAIVFDQLHQPAAGSLIEVSYDVECL